MICCEECGRVFRKGESYRKFGSRFYCRSDECLSDLAWNLLREHTSLGVVE